MAQINIKTGGTRTSGASTADDWTDANCYPTINDSSGVWTADTIVTLDNQAPIVESGSIGTADFSLATNTVTFNVRDSTAKATLSINSATAALFNAAPVTPTVTFDNIIFTREVEMTSGATVGLIYLVGTTLLTLTFTDCEFGDFDISAWEPASKNGKLFTSLSTVSRTNSFINCTFRDVVDTVAGDSGLIRCGGSNQTYNFTNCAWQDCAALVSADMTVGAWLYAENNSVLNVTNCTAARLTCDAAATTTMVRPFYFIGQTTPTLNLDGFTFTDVRVGAAVATTEGNGWGFYIKHAHSVRNVHSLRCAFNNSFGFDGGQMYIDGAGAVQSAVTSNLSVTTCESRSGACLFVSNGASGTYERLLATDCDTDAGVIYSGGSGDIDIRTALVVNCRSTAGNDGQIFVRNNSETRNKVATISNATVIDCTSGGSCAGIKIENNTAGYTMTATINNCIVRNPGNTNEIEEDAGSTVTTNNCNVENAVSVTTENDTTTDDPVLNSHYAPTVASLIASGVKAWTGAHPVGVDGEPFPSWDISVGAVQIQKVPSHPTQL